MLHVSIGGIPKFLPALCLGICKVEVELESFRFNSQRLLGKGLPIRREGHVSILEVDSPATVSFDLKVSTSGS
jgi:hypothetical protein